MACNLVTNRARSLRSLIDSGAVDENLIVLQEAEFNDANINKTKELENIIGSSIPNATFAYGTNPNFVITNDELFRRADAAEGIIYDENYEFKDNYQYPVLAKDEYSKENGDAKLTELLSNIGVSVNFDNPRYKNIGGAADTFHKVAYASINKQGVSTLPEEAAHMFVDYIEQNSPALFNKMMADIPKYGIYANVKEEYFPIYNDINKVKKEAIGKAISKYLVGNNIDKNQEQLKTWFDKVLDFVKNALAKFGINTQEDYNNYFEITADKILRGDFVGKFEGSGDTFFNTGQADKLDVIDAALELRPVIDNGVETTAYFFNGVRVKQRVTEKIRDKNRTITPPTPEQVIAMKVGTEAHEDLMNLWKIKIGEKTADNVIPKTPANVFSKLSLFVDTIYNQFPNAKFRIEHKIFDSKTSTAGTIDLLIEEEDGTLNILDYKFREKNFNNLEKNYLKQLEEYKRILSQEYKIKKFGQIRIIPFKTHYTGKLENKQFQDIDFGTNTLQDDDRSHLNPLPAPFETTKDERINRTIQHLNEELARSKITATGGSPILESVKTLREATILQTIARLQISRDITALEDIAGDDKRRMENILKKDSPTNKELAELKLLRDYYYDFIGKKYNIDNEGNESYPLTEISVFAQTRYEDIEAKLEEFYNSHDIDTSVPNKPINSWSRFAQLSDYDNSAFKAFYKLINKGFNQTEIKIKKEYEEIKGMMEQIRTESGKSGVEMYEPILQKLANGKYGNKLISKNSSAWYEMHESVKNDSKLKSTLNQYFDTKAWKEYHDPLEKEFLELHKGVAPDELSKKLDKFRRNEENRIGINNPNSKFFTVPDKFLNSAYLEHIKNKPNSGLAKLYNKFVDINKFANDNTDSNIPYTLLPFVKKSTMEMLMNEGFNIKNLTTNALNKMKSYEWETFEYDSKGHRVYKIPLKYKGTERANEDQSHDLGEMLMLWTESVYNNAYLQDTHATAQLFQAALKKSKEIALDSAGKPILENGELRLVEIGSNPNSNAIQNMQEYINGYFYGVKYEETDVDVLGFSGQKLVTTAMSYLSGKAIGFNVFSAFSNLTGGVAQAITLASKGNQFGFKQLTKAIGSLHDPKMRALISLLDVSNNQFQKEKAINLSANKSESFVTWDKLYVLQKGGDWLIQNSILGAMGQNYVIDVDAKGNKEIRKKKDGDGKSLIESMDFDKDGKVVIEGLDLNKEEDYLTLLKFREKVRRIGAEVSGNVSEHDRFLADNTLKGQLMLQFRRWILPMANSRFQKLKHNVNLDEYQIGKFRSTVSILATKKLHNVIGEFIKEQHSPTLDAIIAEKYDAALLLNPNLTFEEFKELYAGNMRSAFIELALLAALNALLYAMDDDDESDDSLVKKIFARGMARTASEISFWYSTDSFMNILQTPVPLMGLVTDAYNQIEAIAGTGWDALLGDESSERKLGEKTAKMIPGVNSYYKLMKDLDQ